ncbi:MAG: bifunctional DNA-binding transcriptional regulator/O6-methylguanine-DNA methyltransferase Ada [Sinimarinibacterium flocculans]|uniref:bifunctional DNA-binding transcriptional regulator/O6-methylguanine-DNA methyltransferase Ada n=1 Tax=Sinimarinibacterium flocculans TaxID=985250 RepID=UPI003C4D1207
MKTSALLEQAGMKPDDDTCWAAVRDRDRAFDGRFFYGVLSTGVYCRPSCASRTPLRRNLRFYAVAADAERDGLRPCKRCKPLARTADEATIRTVRELCRYIQQHSDQNPGLEQLSRRAHLSPSHLQRRFKAVLGVSPKDFVESCRLDALKRKLRDGRSVAAATYDAGFGSSSRVYERAAHRLGMTPRQYRAGGRGVDISWALSETPLGLLMIGASDRGLCFVQFGASESELCGQLQAEFPQAAITPMPANARDQFAQWMQALSRHLSGRQIALDLPLDLRGTAFQMKVWNYLLKIPYGELRSYSEVAQAIGAPRAVRAVASACAANRVGLVVPCHRVIRGDGGLGGYRWGLERKRSLIDLERGVRTAGA